MMMSLFLSEMRHQYADADKLILDLDKFIQDDQCLVLTINATKIYGRKA